MGKKNTPGFARLYWMGLGLLIERGRGFGFLKKISSLSGGLNLNLGYISANKLLIIQTAGYSNGWLFNGWLLVPVRHSVLHPLVVTAGANVEVFPWLRGAHRHGINSLAAPADFKPFVDFRMAVSEREAAGVVMIAGRKIPPFLSVLIVAGIMHEGRVVYAVGVFVEDDVHHRRARDGQIYHFCRAAGHPLRSASIILPGCGILPLNARSAPTQSAIHGDTAHA